MREPKMTIPTKIDVAAAERYNLRNGATLYTLHSDDFEVIRFTILFRAGSTKQSKPFCASTTLNMLSEGSVEMTAHQIAERLDYYGSHFEVSIDRDNVYINFASLSKFFAQTLEIASQIVLHPEFPTQELRTYCAKQRQRLTVERSKIDVKAREAFAKALFGGSHPYGGSSSEELYDCLTREDLQSQYERYYTAQNSIAVASGKVTVEQRMLLEQLLEQLPEGECTEITMPDVAMTHNSFVEHAGAVQSSLRVGRMLFSREHPDFIGMQVVAMALGGYFGSRLMQALREERGYTYGVVSAVVNFDKAGYFAIATQVGSDVTEDALNVIYAEIERLCTEEMGGEELQLVKNMMVGEMMRILDGPFGVADVTIENILCGADNSIINSNIAKIIATTPADLQALAKKYLRRDDMVTVVVGSEELSAIFG